MKWVTVPYTVKIFNKTSELFVNAKLKLKLITF